MTTNSQTVKAFLLGAFGAGAWIAGPAHAQTADNSNAVTAEGLTEVIVTSSKLGSTRLLETPISIQALTGDMLETRGIQDFEDYMAMVPSLSAWDQGPGNKRYILRGVNGGTGAGTIGLYLDEIVITGEDAHSGGGMQPDVKLYDMDRIEVIKGPQSTTFGSSAMAGVIRFLTKKPNLHEVEGYAEAGLSYQDHAGVGETVEGAFSMPLKEDLLAVRMSGYYTNLPGYLDTPFQSGVNNEETLSGRFQALLKLSDRLDLSFMAMYQKTETDGASSFTPLDYWGNVLPPRYQYPQERLPWSDVSWRYNVTGHYDTGVGLITATASRNDRDTSSLISASQVMANSAGLPPREAAEMDGLRSVLWRPKTQIHDTYELRFASEFSGPVQILVGSFYQEDGRDWASRIPTVNSQGYIDPSAGVLYGPMLQDRSTYDEVTELAFFGQATWNVTDQWSLTAGMRRFDIETSNQAWLITTPLGRPGSGEGPVNVTEESSTIGRVNVSFKPTPGTLLYAEVGEGFRAGGANDTSVSAITGIAIPAGYGADSLVNYEVGYKASLFDRRLSLTAAAFYIDWTDMQVSVRTPTNPSLLYIANANRAEVRGAELEVQVLATDGLTIGGSVGYTDSALAEAVVGGGRAGDQIPYTSKITAALFADYRWPLGARLDAFVGADVTYKSKQFSDFPQNVFTYKEFDAYELVNLRAGVEWDDWKASLVVKNLLNDDTLTDFSQANPPRTIEWYFYNAPRTVSLMLNRKF